MAAARTVPAGRAPTAMQLLFLQGARHHDAIGFDVTALQDGKRYTSRHVRGAQSDGRLVCDAQVTFAVALPAPAHAAPVDPAALREVPDDLPRLSDLPRDWANEILRALSYDLIDKAAVDFRLPAAAEGLRLDLPEPRLRFWLKASRTLPDDPPLQASAFAYLSDWWLNFPGPGGHLAQLAPDQALYVASLNHAIWWHRPFRADEWLHFDCVSPAAADGRGLTLARIHDRHGRMVASATQECLMAPRAAP
jgi:acyl-CoA thioesterase-2